MRHRFALVVVAALAGCSGATESGPAFTFSVTVAIDDAIDVMTVDRDPIALMPAGAGRELEWTMSYADYETAQATAPVRIEMLGSGRILHHGEVKPGACAQTCPEAFCPQGNDLRAEELQLPFDADFRVYDYQCMNCVGEDRSVPACI